MDHFIITRFSMKLGDTLPRHAHKYADPGWLDYRLQLFRRFTLPTMLHQTQFTFRWLVMLHWSAPEIIRSAFTEFQACFPELIPIYTEANGGQVGQVAAEFIRENAKSDWIITTRLDSDDAVSVRFAETIQRHARPQLHGINLQHGWSWFQHQCWPESDESNNTISLVEQIADFGTVFRQPHYDINGIYPTEQVKDGRYWAVVSHGDNISRRNVPNPKLKRAHDEVACELADFPFDRRIALPNSALRLEAAFADGKPDDLDEAIRLEKVSAGMLDR